MKYSWKVWEKSYTEGVLPSYRYCSRIVKMEEL